MAETAVIGQAQAILIDSMKSKMVRLHSRSDFYGHLVYGHLSNYRFALKFQECSLFGSDTAFVHGTHGT